MTQVGVFIWTDSPLKELKVLHIPHEQLTSEVVVAVTEGIITLLH